MSVMLPVSTYEAIMDKLDDLHIQLTARDRLQSFDRARAISHEEMLQRFFKPKKSIWNAETPRRRGKT